MYQAQLKNNENGHESDWCKGQTEKEAKKEALKNYKEKYPDDNLNDTEYLVKPA